MDFDLEELAAIIELLDGAEFTEFRLEKGDLRLVVRRGAAGDAPATPSADLPAPAGPSTAARLPPAPAPATPSPPPAPTPAGPGADLQIVRAPMLGTAYRSPRPGEPPFVALGDRVSADTVICVVEVMKLMNSVAAGESGEVAEIYVADGDLVEFNAPLLGLRRVL